MATILLALGANLGDRGETLIEAVDRLAADEDFDLIAASQLYVTKPVGGPEGQPDFLNSAARLVTTLSPQQVHQKIIKLEETFGRVRVQRWGARSLDIDLLLYDDQTINTPDLVVPHPRMSFRRFVMQPAAEVAAEMVHPQVGVSIGELWNHLSGSSPTVEIATIPGPLAERLASLVQQTLSDFSIDIPQPKQDWTGTFEQVQEKYLQQIDLSESLSSASERQVHLRPWWSGMATLFSDKANSESFDRSKPRLVVTWLPTSSCSDDFPECLRDDLTRQKFEQKLIELARRHVRGPSLWLIDKDTAEAVIEVTAAIQAMMD